MRSAAAVALGLLALAACTRRPEPGQESPPKVPVPAPFSMRDLAAATALDARLARFSLVAADVQAALPAPAVTPVRARAGNAGAGPDAARKLLPVLDAARGDVEQAVAEIVHAGDRVPATAALPAVKALAGKLAAAATGDAAAVLPELLSARDALATAIADYRGARARWRLDAPEPQGVEREYAEARREMERVESAFGSRTRVAPREEGHELDPAAARMTGVMAARRARSVAGQLPAPLRDPAVRYAAAEEQALEALTSLAGAPDAERAAIARRYHAAKADALAALADYFAALASR